MRNHRHSLGIRADVRSQLHRMVLPMQIKNAINCQCLDLVWLKGTLEMDWTKGYRLILGTLENVLVHFLVSVTVSAFAAGRINDEKSCHLPCFRIKMH